MHQRQKTNIVKRTVRVVFSYGPVLPLVLFLLLASIVPQVFFLSRGVQNPQGQLSLVEFQNAFDQPAYLKVIWNTIKTGILVDIIILLLGYPVALTIHLARGFWRTVLLLAVLLPFFTSVLVRTFAWSVVLGLHGPVNSALLVLGILNEPVLLGHSAFGTGIGLVHILMPPAILAMWTMMARINPDLVTTAQSLGAGPVRAFWDVFFPLSWPGIMLGGLLVFVLALGAYVIPAALGGVRDLMFGPMLVLVASVVLDWAFAAALSTIFLVFLIVPILILLRGGQFGNTTGEESQSSSRIIFRRLGKPFLRWMSALFGPLRFLGDMFGKILDQIPAILSRTIRGFFAYAVIVFLVVPEVLIVVLSFGDPQYLSWPPRDFTAAGFVQFFDEATWTRSLGFSLQFGVLSMLVSLVLGSLAAYGLVRGTFRFKSLVVGLALLPLVLPEIVQSIAYYIFISAFGISGTSLAIVAGQSTTGCGLVMLVMTAVFRSLNVEIEYAARASGASARRAFFDVVVPIVWPSFIVAGLYSFLNSFDNLLIPLFVGGAKQTLPVRMWLQMVDSTSPMITVVASIMVFSVIIIGAFAGYSQRIQRRRLSQ